MLSCRFVLAFLLCVQPVTVAAIEDSTGTYLVDDETNENSEEIDSDDDEISAEDATANDTESETLADNTESVDENTELEYDNEMVDDNTELIEDNTEFEDANETVDDDTELIEDNTKFKDDNETIDIEPEELLIPLSMPTASIQRASFDRECWVIAPSIPKNKDVLMLETPAGVSCLPETVPAKLFEVEYYESDPFGYVGESIDAEYVVDYIADGQGNVLDKEYDFSAPDLYTVHATIIIPPGYIQSTDRDYKGKPSFYFIITVTAPEPDWCFSNYKVSNAYAEAGTSPDTWDLQDRVVCSIKDRNFSQPDIELGSLPITWDLDSIVIEAPGVDANGEYEATVHGVITVTDDMDITGVDGINGDRTVPVEIYVIVRKIEAVFGFLRPTKYITNPEFKDAGEDPYVSFSVNFIEESWGSDFSIWLTDDDGKTFTDVNGSENVVIYAGGRQEYVVSYVDFYNLEYNKWYGVCLELRGDYSYAGTTETIYFMFTEDDVYSEPSGGDRNGDGRWPFISSGNNEQPPTGGNAPEDNANDNNSNNNGSSASSDSSSGGSPTVTSSFSFGSDTGSLTGKRLDALMTVYPYNVPFVSNGSQLQILAEFIKSLGISQSGAFSVNVSKVNKNSFSIQLKVNGKATDDSGEKPYTARIPYTPANGEVLDNLLIADSDGNIQPASYYDSSGYFVLKTNQFGDFSILEGKPVSFSDFENDDLDFLSARGIITGVSGQKFNPSDTAKQSDLYIILENLSGDIEHTESQIYPQTALTYSLAVSLLEKYAEQIGGNADRKELLSLLSLSENTALSRYGCIKLAAEFIKNL